MMRGGVEVEETSKNQENKGRKKQREVSRSLGCGQTDDDGGGQWMEKTAMVWEGGVKKEKTAIGEETGW